MGEWWTPLIIRDIVLGVRRFEQIRVNLGISRKVLSGRLIHLLEHGVLKKVAYKDGRTREEYHLTQKGWAFVTSIVAITQWGDEWECPEGGPPIIPTHKNCGGRVEAKLICDVCGPLSDGKEVTARRGPGAQVKPGTLLIAEHGYKPDRIE